MSWLLKGVRSKWDLTGQASLDPIPFAPLAFENVCRIYATRPALKFGTTKPHSLNFIPTPSLICDASSTQTPSISGT